MNYCEKSDHRNDLDWNYRVDACPYCQIEVLTDRIALLEAAIVTTLNGNGHLADGDNCTLIDLKRAVPEWELK